MINGYLRLNQFINRLITFLVNGVSLIDRESIIILTISSDFSALSIQNIIASPIDLRSVLILLNNSSNLSRFLKILIYKKNYFQNFKKV